MALALAVLLAATAVPAATFTTATVERGTAVEVESDQNAIVGLVIEDRVDLGGTSELVTVTNGAERELTVAITLTDDVGELVVDGETAGDAATVELSPGETRTVEIDVALSCDLRNELLSFDVDATTETFTSHKERSTRIVANHPDCTPGGGDPGPPGDGDPGPPGGGSASFGSHATTAEVRSS